MLICFVCYLRYAGFDSYDWYPWHAEYAWHTECAGMLGLLDMLGFYSVMVMLGFGYFFKIGICKRYMPKINFNKWRLPLFFYACLLHTYFMGSLPIDRLFFLDAGGGRRTPIFFILVSESFSSFFAQKQTCLRKTFWTSTNILES